MEQTAQNAYSVRYSLRHTDDTRLALTFIVTGEEANLLLLEAQERSGPQDIRANPGRVDQRVYRLGRSRRSNRRSRRRSLRTCGPDMHEALRLRKA
jgi:hypothetical protein